MSKNLYKDHITRTMRNNPEHENLRQQLQERTELLRKALRLLSIIAGDNCSQLVRMQLMSAITELLNRPEVRELREEK